MAVADSEESSVEATKVESIEELFAALESPLLQYAFRLLQTRSAAEDVVQEAFLKLHDHFEDVREPRRWLYRTVHNLALNHQRHAGKIVSIEAASDSAEAPPRELIDPQLLPDEQIARLESIGLVRLSLANLDPRSRELIQLKFHHGLSYQEMGARTGLSVSNVGYLLHHALKSIAAELARSGMP